MSGAVSAQALLRALGGAAVLVRFALPPGGEDGEELGLASPEFHEVELRPVLVRLLQGRTTVLADASVMESTLGTDDVKAVLLSASSVTVRGESFRIEAVERRAVFGRAYLYRLLLAEKEGAR